MPAMSRRNHHKWHLGRVQPASSEWPSTLHSTQIGDDETPRPTTPIARRLRREVPLGNVIVALIAFLAVGGLGIHVLAHFLHR
jgi:hypothetical protein